MHPQTLKAQSSPKFSNHLFSTQIFKRKGIKFEAQTWGWVLTNRKLVMAGLSKNINFSSYMYTKEPLTVSIFCSTMLRMAVAWVATWVTRYFKFPSEGCVLLFDTSEFRGNFFSSFIKISRTNNLTERVLLMYNY